MKKGRRVELRIEKNPEVIENRKRVFAAFLCFAASACMLTVIQAPFNMGWLAWVAMVPFVYVCTMRVRGAGVFILCYAVSLFYWLGNLYWVAPVTIAGWLAFSFYTALLWPLLLFGLRFCIEKRIPLFLAAGFLIVGVEQLQGFFLGGFYWRHLAHSQYANLPIIQIADIFGAAGVSFLVAMVNGLIVELIAAGKERRIRKVGIFVKVVFVSLAVGGSIFYGRWRLGQTAEAVVEGPMVGLMQSNVPQSVKESLQKDEVIFGELLAKSTESLKSGAELTVWPETMVLGILDKGILDLLGEKHQFRSFDKSLREHAKSKGYVLAGATGAEGEKEGETTVKLLKRYNSAFLYTPEGQQAKEHYNKIHLVPFGEVVPFRKSAVWLHKILMMFTPYKDDYSLDYGGEYTVFTMKGRKKPNETYRFGVLICYEDTVPKIAKRFAVEGGRKKVDWLLNISNDGWFVPFRKDGRIYPSAELAQHAAICVFRAVENRVAVLRSVNTGISCVIESTGRIRNGFSASSEGFAREAMKRKGAAGWFNDTVPIDKRVTFFSRHRAWLDDVCRVLFVLCVIVGFAAVRKGKGRRKEI